MTKTPLPAWYRSTPVSYTHLDVYKRQVYSEMDQEMGQRLSYAIDHTEGVDDRLRKAADLMRSWDGRLTTDSVAASIVTTTRQALWPMILEPKLGKDAAAYRWEESNFAEEEIVMHARADWLPPGYKNWDALLTAAVRKGMDNGKAPADVTTWHYGDWHVVDLEHPLARYLPLVGRIAGTGPHPLSGDTTTVKQVNISFGPSQRFTIDWSDVDGSTPVSYTHLDVYKRQADGASMRALRRRWPCARGRHQLSARSGRKSSRGGG